MVEFLFAVAHHYQRDYTDDQGRRWSVWLDIDMYLIDGKGRQIEFEVHHLEG